LQPGNRNVRSGTVRDFPPSRMKEGDRDGERKNPRKGEDSVGLEGIQVQQEAEQLKGPGVHGQLSWGEDQW
jgi:hypothetical protein